MSGWYTNQEGKHVPINPGQSQTYTEPQMQIQQVATPKPVDKSVQNEYNQLKKNYPAITNALEQLASLNGEEQINLEKALMAVKHLSDGQKTIVEQTLRELQGKTVMQISEKYHVPEEELKFVAKDDDAFQAFISGQSTFNRSLKQRDSNFTLADSVLTTYNTGKDESQ